MAILNTHDAVWSALEDLRARRPLVHNITNYVAMTVSANVLLALGASPAMVHAAEEVEDFVGISDALCVNIGTLSPPWVAAMRKAVDRADALGKPWVLDPVGCGATPYRTDVAIEGGHALMPLSTALGCALSAVVAAFTAVRPAREAAVAALAVFGAAGAVAARNCRGPGHLPAELCDALYLMDRDTLQREVRFTG